MNIAFLCGIFISCFNIRRSRMLFNFQVFIRIEVCESITRSVVL